MSNEKSDKSDGSVRVQHPTSPPMLGSPQAWSVVEAEADAVAADAVIIPRIDLQAASEKALSVVDDLSDDAALMARFKLIASTGEVSSELISQVRRYASGAWYARHRQMQAEDGERTETVPEATLTRANELFTRMHKLATYHFADHPDEGPLVVVMNGAPGHRKLANHLVTLSEL